MKNRVLKLRAEMERLNLDAILIEESKNKRYISGFTGTAGSIIILKKKTYYLQTLDIHNKPKIKQRILK